MPHLTISVETPFENLVVEQALAFAREMDPPPMVPPMEKSSTNANCLLYPKAANSYGPS